MNVLFVCHRVPFPPTRGGKIRPFNMIRHLARSHSVTVVSLAASPAELEAGRELTTHGVDLVAEVLPPATRWRQAGLSLPTRFPSSVAYFASANLRRRVRALARRTSFDVVMVHCAFVAHYVDGVPAGQRIMDFGDLDSAKWLAYARHRRPPLSWGYGIEAGKLRRHERALAGRFDRCTVTTQGELDEFRSLGVATPCAVIPNGVDGERFSPAGAAAAGPPSIVFLGRFDYFPNIDGALYFARSVFPLVRQRVPAAELRLVGANPAKAVRQLARLPGVSVFADVPAVRPFLQQAAVSVAPLRIARGTQNKILESMATGIAVVATSQAAKGIQAVPGDHLLVADEPEPFAASVAALLTDPALRSRLAAAGRTQVQAAHDWAASMRKLDELLGLPSESVRPIR